MVFNWAVVNSYDPIRFPGTWKQYSKNAIPQLAGTTYQRASLLYFRCPYHAKVMKMFEIVSSTIVRTFQVPVSGIAFTPKQPEPPPQANLGVSLTRRVYVKVRFRTPTPIPSLRHRLRTGERGATIR